MVFFRFKTKMRLSSNTFMCGKSLIARFSCTVTYSEAADMLCNPLRSLRNVKVGVSGSRDTRIDVLDVSTPRTI